MMKSRKVKFVYLSGILILFMTSLLIRQLIFSPGVQGDVLKRDPIPREKALVDATGWNPTPVPDEYPISWQTQERVYENIYLLRQFTLAGRPEVWAGAIRSLAEIGPPAVPALIAELFRNHQDLSQSAVAVALRAIGDKRAIPGLIDALDVAYMGRSDMGGFIVEDLDLLKFMIRFDNDPAEYGDEFSLGVPIREIQLTLHSLTGHSEDISWVNTRTLAIDGDPKGIKQFEENRHHAVKIWRDWWELSKGSLLTPAQIEEANTWKKLAESDPIEEAGLDEFGPVIPYGPHIRFATPVSMTLLRKIQKSGAITGDCLDFETGQIFDMPEGLLQPPLYNLMKWEHEHQVDAIAVVNQTPQGSFQAALSACDCMVWKLDNARWDTLEKELQSDNPPSFGRPKTLFSLAAERPPYPHTFLFKTRENHVGMVQVLGLNDDNTGVRIQYKMLENSPPLNESTSAIKSATSAGQP